MESKTASNDKTEVDSSADETAGSGKADSSTSSKSKSKKGKKSKSRKGHSPSGKGATSSQGDIGKIHTWAIWNTCLFEKTIDNPQYSQQQNSSKHHSYMHTVALLFKILILYNSKVSLMSKCMGTANSV